MKFRVIDNNTGKDADAYEIALHEEWAQCLVYCDMEGFFISEDGQLILADECGNFVYCDPERFKLVFEDEKPHGTWVDVPKYKGFYVCSKCLERLDGDFERFDHWEMKKDNFCSVCGSDNRKMGDQNET